MQAVWTSWLSYILGCLNLLMCRTCVAESLLALDVDGVAKLLEALLIKHWELSH